MVDEPFSDERIEIDDLIAEGDRVALRFRLTATHSGAAFGVPATGRQITTSGTKIYTVRAGRIVRIAGHDDVVGVLRQLGVVELPLPEPGAGPAAGRRRPNWHSLELCNWVASAPRRPAPRCPTPAPRAPQAPPRAPGRPRRSRRLTPTRSACGSRRWGCARRSSPPGRGPRGCRRRGRRRRAGRRRSCRSPRRRRSRAARSPASKVAPSLRDSWVMRASGKRPRSSATRSSMVADSSARVSSVHATLPGIELVDPGVTSTRPTVPTAPGRARAASSTASTNRAACTSASRRPAIGVVPAWLDSPVELGPPALTRARARRPPRAPGRGRPAPGPARRAPRGSSRCARARPGLRAATRGSRRRSRVRRPCTARTASMSSSPAMAWLAKQERAEARALLVDERDHRQRMPCAARPTRAPRPPPRARRRCRARRRRRRRRAGCRGASRRTRTARRPRPA